MEEIPQEDLAPSLREPTPEGKAYLERLAQEPKEEKPTALDLWKSVKSVFHSRGWVIDEDNREVIKLLCLYFANDNRFSGSLDKGIMLRGGYGTGKTELMRIFCRNGKQSFEIVPALTIAENFAGGGYEKIAKYKGMIPAGGRSAGGQKYLSLCIDEVGYEPIPALFYTHTRENVVAYILWNRYSGTAKNATHITTNLGNGRLLERYEERVYSRMFDMFNVIDFPANAKDWRKQ